MQNRSERLKKYVGKLNAHFINNGAARRAVFIFRCGNSVHSTLMCCAHRGARIIEKISPALFCSSSQCNNELFLNPHTKRQQQQKRSEWTKIDFCCAFHDSLIETTIN
jgi:hypothetical protein